VALRSNFDTDVLQLSGVLGLVLMVIIIPEFVQSILPERYSSIAVRSKSLILFFLLFFLASVGFFMKEGIGLLITLISATGFGLFFWLLATVVLKEKIWRVFLLAFTAIAFSALVTGVALSIHAKPLFFEDIMAGTFFWSTDTLFHAANAQMFKTYGVFSPGLEGVGYIPYHYGSHFLYCVMSKVVEIRVLDAYLIFPAVFAGPLFVLTFTFVVEEARKISNINPKIGPLFLLVFFLLFAGYIRNHFYGFGGVIPQYAGLLLGSPILFLSDSFTVSLIFVNLFLATALQAKIISSADKRQKIGVTIILLVLFVCASYSKISTMYMLMALISYVYLRFQLFRSIKYIFVYLCFIGVSFVIYYLIRDPKYGDGGLDFMYHFNQSKQNFFAFIIIHFLWVWVVIISIAKSTSFRSQGRFGAEVLFVLLIAALLPAVFLKIEWGQINYFTEIPTWYAGAILLACMPALSTQTLTFNRALSWPKKIIAVIIILFLVNTFFLNIKAYFSTMVGLNVATRNAMLNRHMKISSTYRFKIMDFILSKDSLTKDIIDPLHSLNFDSVRVAPVADILKKLSALDTIPLIEKKRSAVYIHFDRLPFAIENSCFERPFLIPALTGMATVNGGLSTECSTLHPWFKGYGFEYYEVPKKNLTLQQILTMCRQHGFRQLYFFQQDKNEFVRVEV
jgi:hypothetical protein